MSLRPKPETSIYARIAIYVIMFIAAFVGWWFIVFIAKVIWNLTISAWSII